MRRYHICRTSRCRPSELLELLQLDWWITRRTARHELRVHRDRTILECFDNASQLDVNRRSCYRIHIRESDIKRMLWTFIFLHVLGVSMSALEAFAVEISHSLVGVWNGSPRVSASVTQKGCLTETISCIYLIIPVGSTTEHRSLGYGGGVYQTLCDELYARLICGGLCPTKY